MAPNPPSQPSPARGEGVWLRMTEKVYVKHLTLTPFPLDGGRVGMGVLLRSEGADGAQPPIPAFPRKGGRSLLRTTEKVCVNVSPYSLPPQGGKEL